MSNRHECIELVRLDTWLIKTRFHLGRMTKSVCTCFVQCTYLHVGLLFLIIIYVCFAYNEYNILIVYLLGSCHICGLRCLVWDEFNSSGPI